MKWSFLLLFLFVGRVSSSQEIIPLYDSIPLSISGPDKERAETDKDGKMRIWNVSRPSLTVFLPSKEKANGTAVIICPGGGYGILAFSHEGTDVAKVFNEWGVTAFVLKYRLPDDAIMQRKEIGPLQDAQRAMQLVRTNAARWNIRKNSIGIMGFSAGGHLASTAGTHYPQPVINAKSSAVRPNFMILIYPVISFSDSLTHNGSRKNLITEMATDEKKRYYSNELQITKKTPPSFLVHAKDDNAVKIGNSYEFVKASRAKKVKSELVTFEKGGHGFGMHNPTTADKWMDQLKVWMKKNKWID